MDVILHLGAHRTGSTTFQEYMTRAQSGDVAYWGPKITRGGLFDGVHGSPVGMRPAIRAKGRIAVQLARAEGLGAKALVISDENMIGPLRGNLRCAALYPEIGLRMARLAAAFGGRITRVVLQVRALDTYWASVLAFGLSRAIASPTPDLRQRLVHSGRRWQDVLIDLSCALPEVPIVVTAFEHHVQRPDMLAELATGRDMPTLPARGIWTNRMMDAKRLKSCLHDVGMPDVHTLFDEDGRWRPFSSAERQSLRMRTAADLAWLRAGADGLAEFYEHPMQEPAIRASPAQETIRGSEDNDSQNRHMAHPC